MATRQALVLARGLGTRMRAADPQAQLTPEQQLTTGVTPGLVRLSVGLENIDDLKADLEAGFAAAQAVTRESLRSS